MGDPDQEAPIGPLTVIIPAYQAAGTLQGVIQGAQAYARSIIVVDDGSTDDTSRVARESGAEVLRHPQNLGKGRALRTGFRAVLRRGEEAVVTMDADGQHLPEEIPRLWVEAGRGADLVIGSRIQSFHGMYCVRRWSNRISSLLISALAGTMIPDLQSGFRLYTRHLLEVTGFQEPRFEAESAVVVRAARRHLRIALVPVRLGQVDGRATSHYRPLVDSCRIGVAVTRARLEALKGELR